MKKLLTSVLSLSIMFSFPLLNMTVSATTNSSGEETYINDDGIEIVYNNDVVNGSVDLNTEPIASSQIDKSKIVKPRASSVEIPITFEKQQNYYYCGPAAAVMTLKAIGFNKTQNQMRDLLGTTEASGTPAGNSVANALNAVVAGSKYQFNWVWHTSTNTSTIKNNVVEALNYGNPVMVNTLEYANESYFAGHGNYDVLYHFGVVADYFNYGNSVTYVDPGYSVFPGFLMNQTVSISDLSNAAGGRGYAW